MDRAIEDTGSLDAHGRDEIYVIANPGEGLTALAFTSASALPKAKRDYDSVEFALEKRFADNGPFVPAICGAGCTVTTRDPRSRTRTGAPARTSAACSTTR